MIRCTVRLYGLALKSPATTRGSGSDRVRSIRRSTLASWRRMPCGGPFAWTSTNVMRVPWKSTLAWMVGQYACTVTWTRSSGRRENTACPPASSWIRRAEYG